MAVDPNIKKKADDIRSKIYGKEVRESLASGLEAMSEDVVENEGRQSVVESRQDSVESQWQSVSDEMTDKDVISAPEIIAARNGESNLKARLDKEKNEVTAQLDKTMQKQKNKEIDVVVDWGIEGEIDQSSKLQSLVNSLPDNSSLYFPNDRIYYIKDIKFIDLNNITIYADGAKIINSDATKNIFEFENVDTVEVRGFDVVSTYGVLDTQHTGLFVSAYNVNRFRISDNKSKRGGISVTKGKTVIVDNNEIYDTEKVIQFGIVLRDIEGAFISRNIVNHVTHDGIKISLELYSPNTGIQTLITENRVSHCEHDCLDTFSGGHKITISSNFFTDSNAGVHSKEVGGPVQDFVTVNGYARDVIISNNHLYNNRVALRIGSTNVLISNNMITNELGDSFGAVVWGKDVKIDNNSFIGIEKAMLIQNFDEHKVDNIIVSNCLFKDITTRAVDIEAGVGDVFFENCVFKNIGNYAIQVRSDRLFISNLTILEATGRAIQYIPQDYENNRLFVEGTKIINNISTLEVGIDITSGSSEVLGGMVSNTYIEGATTRVRGAIMNRGNSWNASS